MTPIDPPAPDEPAAFESDGATKGGATTDRAATLDIARDLGYQPGVCNIGPEEIARRRRSGHVGLLAAVGLFAGLVALRAPRPARALVALPAAGAAAGYLQARLRFCAGFGAMGVYNFGAVGETVRIDDRGAAARDRARAMRIGIASLAVGVAAGIAAALVPLD